MPEDQKRVLSGESKVNQGKSDEGVNCKPERDNKVMLSVKAIQSKTIH